MFLYNILLLCASLVLNVDCQLAPFITPCRPNDADCLRSSAQNAISVVAAGIPSFEMEPLDPMNMERVQANQAGLQMDFRNTIVKGLRNGIVMSLKRQGKKLFLDYKGSVTLVGDYTLSGRLLVLPIEGDGKYKIKIRDIVVKIQLDIADKQSKGETYWQVTNWRHSADVLTNVEFQFQNLFHGNKQLSDSIHQFANTNWKDIFNEVSPPIVKTIVSQIVNNTKKLFDHVPVNQLAIE